MRDDSFLAGAARAFAGPPLGLVALATVVLAIGDAGGLLGIPVLVLCGYWVFTYAYLLVAATAHGRPLPVLAVEHANPWHEPRPLLQFVLLATAAGLAWWLDRHVGAWAAAAVGALALLGFPASLALLAVEGEALRAASPLAMARVAAGLGARYAALVVLAAGYAALLAALARVAPRIVLLAAAQLLLFSLATALGTALYARRHQLGLDAWQSPERDAERAARDAERERAALATELYGQIRARHPELAWRRASEWLQAAGREPEAIRWLRDRALEWGERRFADRLGEELVARLVALGRRGEALAEVEACWRRGGECAPADYRDRDVLEGVARELGRDVALARLRAQRGGGHERG
ncbi:MAG TPA: hypothetical protein VMU00_01195 [Steroidobacteraceae bacterium]|nr:hypothetical protein [Steroidobacteraceae bacterium]